MLQKNEYPLTKENFNKICNQIQGIEAFHVDPFTTSYLSLDGFDVNSYENTKQNISHTYSLKLKESLGNFLEKIIISRGLPK